MVGFGSLASNALKLLHLASFVAALRPLELGQVRRYDLKLTWEKASPDGYERDVFKVNGQFPGPTLEFNQGDEVEVHVENESPWNTTIHHHGIEMLNTPWSDGVPGVTQLHIQPGCAFTYRWTATQHGTYFYHSHSDSQIADGLYGPIVIHPDPKDKTPYSLITTDIISLAAMVKAESERIPLIISDWRHYTSDAEWRISEQSRIEQPCFDSMLFNGQGKVNCLTPEQQEPLITPAQKQLLGSYKLTDKSCLPPQAIGDLNDLISPVKSDVSVIPYDLFNGCTPTDSPGHVITITQELCDIEKWVMFDIIGAASVHGGQVSIDEIRTYVVAMDGNWIVPVEADSLMLTNGQRYTLLAKFVEPKKYTLRFSSQLDPQILFGTATIDFQVEGKTQSTAPSKPFINERGVALSSTVIQYDGKQATPFPAGAHVPSSVVDGTYKVTMGFGVSLNQFVFNATVRPETAQSLSPPMLMNPQPGLQDNHTITVPSAMSWVDYIMLVPPGQAAHPIHFHGRHFYVLGYGIGDFPWKDVAEANAAKPGLLNVVNPQLRDTFLTPQSSDPTQGSWLVFRRASDNEGVWLIHCHIQSHLQGGMSMVIQDGTDGGIAVAKGYREYQCAAP